MRSFFNYLTWGLFAVFAIPTILVLGSWNSLPGQPMYGVKLGLEQVLLVAVSPSFQTKGDLSIKYTERRFSENQRLLSDKGSVAGLAYLDKQVVATKDVIVQGQDVKAQAALAQKYIDTLNDVSQQLAAQQQAIATQQVAVAPSGGNATNPPAQTYQAPQPTAVQAPATQTFQPTQPAYQAPSPTAQTFYAAPTPTTYVPPAQAPVKQQAPPPQQQVQQPAAQPPPPAQQPAGAAVQKAVAVEQIKQSQETIKETIKELEKVTKKAEQEDKKQEQQPSEKGNKSGGKD